MLALDEHERVLLVHQYRHPVRMRLWELPAGLLDVAGEEPVAVRPQRELAEEADLVARAGTCWSTGSTPRAGWTRRSGCSSPATCARCRSTSGTTRHGEELDMPTRWVAAGRRRDAVLAGRLHNPGTGGRGARRLRRPGPGLDHPAPAGRALAGAPATTVLGLGSDSVSASGRQGRARLTDQREGRRSARGQEQRVPGGDHPVRGARAGRGTATRCSIEKAPGSARRSPTRTSSRRRPDPGHRRRRLGRRRPGPQGQGADRRGVPPDARRGRSSSPTCTWPPTGR